MQQEYRCLLKLTPIVKDFLGLYGQGSVPWTCRVPISKNALLDKNSIESAFVPIHLSVWMKSHPTQGWSVMTRLNMILHSFEGFILGASIYSMRDSFDSLSKNSHSVLPLHGSIHWFVGHTFESPKSHSNSKINTNMKMKTSTLNGIPTAYDLIHSVRPSTLIMWILISITLTLGSCILFYMACLKPDLIMHQSKKIR